MPVYKSKTPTKDGRQWFFKVSYVDSYGNTQKYVSKKFIRQSDAKDEERIFMTQVKDERKNIGSMTLGELWDDFVAYQDSRVKISTKANYKHSRPYFEKLFNIPCRSFTIKQFESLRNDLIKNDKIKTVSKNDKLKVFRTVLNYGRKVYGYDFSSVLATPSRIKDPNKIKTEHTVYSTEEFQQFLSAEDNLRFRCLWEMLYFCGLRIGEARGLQWRDIDWNTNTVSINKQVMSIDNIGTNYYVSTLKTSSSYRKLVMCTSLANDLKRYQEECKQFDNYSDDFWIFGDDYGVMPLSHNKPQRRKKKIANIAGVKVIRLHDFRHSCASMLISKGVPIPTVSKYLGHANITETLNTYSHSLASDFDNVSNVLDNIF